MSETTKTKAQLKEEFIKNRGYWSKFWEDVLELDSNFFSTYSRFSSVPSKNNALSPKIREFIYIAIDASTTHLYLPGLKLHMENALALGATRDAPLDAPPGAPLDAPLDALLDAPLGAPLDAPLDAPLKSDAQTFSDRLAPLHDL